MAGRQLIDSGGPTPVAKRTSGVRPKAPAAVPGAAAGARAGAAAPAAPARPKYVSLPGGANEPRSGGPSFLAAQRDVANKREVEERERNTVERIKADREAKHDKDLSLDSKTGSRLAEGVLPSVSQLGEAEYQALTPAKRAAVDFNSALVRAVEADKEAIAPGKGTPEETSYRQAASRLFGEAPAEYAPNTVALLDAIGMTDQAATIDDYLQLRSAVFQTDLGVVDQPRASKMPGVPGNAVPVRIQHVQELTDKTAELIAAFQGPGFSRVGGGVPVGGFTTEAVPDRIGEYVSKALASMGGRDQYAGEGASLDEVLGTSAPDADPDFVALYELTTRKDQVGTWTYDDLVTSLQSAGKDPAAYFQFAGEQLSGYERRKTQDPTATIGTGAEGEFLTPEEYRTLLGLTRG